MRARDRAAGRGKKGSAAAPGRAPLATRPFAERRPDSADGAVPTAGHDFGDTPATALVQAKFWEWTGKKHVWHKEDPGTDFVSTNQTYRGTFDVNSCPVYLKKRMARSSTKSPMNPIRALEMLNDTYSGVHFVEPAQIVRHTDETWGDRLEEVGEDDSGDASFSGFTHGASKAPSERRIDVHKDREKIDTMIHELVHANAGGPNVELALGEAMNEGMTEYLARRAMVKGGWKPSGHYERSTTIIGKLVAKVGLATIVNTYFQDSPEILDRALERQGIDLADITSILGHNYIRLGETLELDLDGPLIVNETGSGESSSGNQDIH